MALRILFIVHAVVTFAAGIVLIIFPAAIPATMDIAMESNAFLVCYLLGASEIALAFLSFGSRNIVDVKSLRLISFTFIVFHVVTALAEVYAFSDGLSAKIWANVALRVIISLLFWYFGVYKMRKTNR